MREQHPSCDHRWRYFVHVDSRAVRARECERCGHRAAVSPERERVTVVAEARVPAA